MNVTDSGNVLTTRTAIIGNGHAGVANVSGNLSKWIVGGALTVGNTYNGTLNVADGGTVEATTQLVVGNTGHGGNDMIGVVNLSGTTSKIDSKGITVIGNETYGTVNITDGAKFYSRGESYVGRMQNGNGTVNISGQNSIWNAEYQTINIGVSGYGRMNLYEGGHAVSQTGNVATGSGGTGYVDIMGLNSRWSVMADAVVGGVGKGRVYAHDKGTLAVSGNLTIGGSSSTSRGWVDLENGHIINAPRIEGGTGKTGKLNLLGPGSTVLPLSGYNLNGNLGTYFYVDSSTTGTSAITIANGGTINLGGITYVSAYGMAVQTIDNEFLVYKLNPSLSSYTGTFHAPEMKVISDYQTTGEVIVTFDQDGAGNAYPVWDIHTQPFFWVGDGREYMGWVNVTGDPHYETFQAYYTYNGETISDSVYQAFVAYINNGLSESGQAILGADRSSEGVLFHFSVDMFTDYQMLGWGLDHFNDLYDSNISLLYLSHVPEPSTWLMLLSGTAAMVIIRKKRKA